MNIIKYTLVVLTVFSLDMPAMAQSPILSLEDCRRMALEQNKKIKASQLLIDAAKAANEAARLNDRPSFDASIIGAGFGSPLNKLLPPVLGSATVSATQPIYAGGKIRLGKEAAAKVVEISEGQKAMDEADLLLAVENAYWQVVQVKEKIVLAQKYKAMLQGLQKELQNSVDAGLTYKNDLLRAEVNLNEAELNIVKAKDGVVMTKLSLAQLIGQAGNTAFSVEDSISGNFTELAPLSLDSTADRRPEINVLRKAIEAEQLQAKIIKADLKPQVALSLDGMGAVGKNINFSNRNNYMVSYFGVLSVSVPIFDWGKNAKKVKEQTFKIQARQLQLEDSKEQINLQVENALLQVNQSVKKINLSSLSLQQADENLRLANDRFTAGTITGKDVLEAQAIWQQAYSSIIDAKTEYKINMANYRKATGELK